MIIQSKKVWIAGQFVPAQIEMKADKITGIYEYGEKQVDKDYEDNRIVPGFIDIHCHGAYTFDTNDAQPEGLLNWVKNITDEGVTGLFPTTITQSKEVLTKALENIVDVVEKGYEGAEILGVHFEGPYLDMKYKGAQPEQHIKKPNVEEFKEYQKAAKGMIKIMTMACEHDEDFKLTEYASQNGVLVSMGHSGSTYEEAVMAVAHGAQSMTHVFNGMTPFQHRNPGLVGAAMRFRDVYGEVICDGNHSNLNAVNNLFMAKGRDYTIMITDALMAKGCPIGSHHMFGGNEIEIYPDGSAHLVEAKSLAGSTLNVNKGLKLLVEEALIPFDYALNSCTLNPARALKIDDRKGKIMTGHDADLVVLDKEYDVIQTYARGVACK
ncbi:N-acetylglucosamine-6-phosphate deacetylase [Breznakia sp. PF5-3]|uniref:N-acetylglucosamine-6-phosphate deacetylase n=1 Tax=unclassified Breznakia TaxID=2623764 RepID=UPI002406E406|nr:MULTISPECIES: N-acetylglucosamine-6-phosphate deacetylase [unclassified Breznakia]MDF9825880.1 N-acetylglucosamine-6-phosphate deacetylase [Breznakia sp. PM6-1]MDF9836676.1 N-acetylglucosamine-6-phosphate deacetylase [Breznakia sp. PF5-3]MDF9838749.1 N-acetylglucosamine-6-phosphate deacetylase [Breznakia sp. PFB2-8]MDF9860763.1 N-acetylglucosamine-6-phosphate deacetylase [Breznakia sp. PH5-24]